MPDLLQHVQHSLYSPATLCLSPRNDITKESFIVKEACRILFGFAFLQSPDVRDCCLMEARCFSVFFVAEVRLASLGKFLG